MKHRDLDFLDFSKEQIYNALIRFKDKYPTVYEQYFLNELKKPFDPFERQSFFVISDEDMELLNKEPAPLKVLVPVTIEEDE
jgi:hypothetical protein